MIDIHRGGPRAAATSKMERFVIIITKRSILDVVAAVDPPLIHMIYVLGYTYDILVLSRSRTVYLRSWAFLKNNKTNILFIITVTFLFFGTYTISYATESALTILYKFTIKDDGFSSISCYNFIIEFCSILTLIVKNLSVKNVLSHFDFIRDF